MSTIMKVDRLPPAKPDLKATRKPDSKIGEFIWRRRMWFESTFVLSMLEPWEKVFLLTIFGLLFTLFMTGLLRYLPQHISVMLGRTRYYLWGQEGEGHLWQWIGKTTGRSEL
ncbi:hypothetical protein C8J56DRAFT_814053 [Mycena floridula]|nr:hypothetical protein C8J56DRAFT_814053 [Mycena floridula]